MFTNSLKRRLNHAAKPTIFDIPNKPPIVGQKRQILRRTTTDIATKGNSIIFIFLSPLEHNNFCPVFFFFSQETEADKKIESN